MAYDDFMELDDIEMLEPIAEAQGVSEVARMPTGFLGAYKRAGGDPDRLSMEWVVKREHFIRRHVANARANSEPWFVKGKPTRRHLALLMWAYTPTPKKLAPYLAKFD